MMRKIHILLKYQLPVLFIAIILLPTINSKLDVWKFERADENRTFQDSINFNIRKLDPFPKEADAYVNDNFSFRAPLIDAYQKLKFSFFKFSPDPKKSIVGYNDWMFMASKEKKIYEGEENYSKKELNKFHDLWKYRTDFLNSRGIKAYWVIAPIKHYVYGEQLPFNVIKSETRRVDQVKERLSEDFPDLIIDPLDTFLEKKGEQKLYYKIDNHWNYHAGEVVTEIITEKLRKDFPSREILDIPPHTWKQKVAFSGYHSKVMGEGNLSEKRDYLTITDPKSIEAEKYGFKVVEGFAYPKEFEMRYTNDSIQSGLRVLFIRDSFCNLLMPFLKEIFKESVFIFDKWQYRLNEAIIEEVKPDVVIFLGLESHLNNVIKYYD